MDRVDFEQEFGHSGFALDEMNAHACLPLSRKMEKMEAPWPIFHFGKQDRAYRGCFFLSKMGGPPERSGQP
jgi:hypothetical protein